MLNPAAIFLIGARRASHGINAMPARNAKKKKPPTTAIWTPEIDRICAKPRIAHVLNHGLRHEGLDAGHQGGGEPSHGAPVTEFGRDRRHKFLADIPAQAIEPHNPRQLPVTRWWRDDFGLARHQADAAYTLEISTTGEVISARHERRRRRVEYREGGYGVARLDAHGLNGARSQRDPQSQRQIGLCYAAHGYGRQQQTRLIGRRRHVIDDVGFNLVLAFRRVHDRRAHMLGAELANRHAQNEYS
ncbi:MAG: hypothetical protein WDN06_15905 [Asticcacaulis sp.]